MVKENEIREVLQRLGVSPSRRGYAYISYGISLSLKDKEYLDYITKDFYMDIAHEFSTSASCVERDIRSAVEAIWRTGSEILPEVCGEPPAERRPSNKKFFRMMYDYFIKLADSEAEDMGGEE